MDSLPVGLLVGADATLKLHYIEPGHLGSPLDSRQRRQPAGPAHILLNLAIGGDWADRHGASATARSYRRWMSIGCMYRKTRSP